MDEPKETPEVFTRDAPRTHTHTHGGVVGNLPDLSQPTESSRPTESNASRQNQKQESAARKASIGGWITTL